MHSCPNCGQACYCKGDIDDIEAEPAAAARCEHCNGEDENNDEHCMECGRSLDANNACASCDAFYGDD